MIRQFLSLLLLFLPFLLSSVEAKTLDPYKVLGVDKSASQRDIQKAFHRLSLQYHPDKNTKKGAQEKFAEINNAYEILSDEEKRKNYDLYGDEQGKPGFGGGDFGSHDGHTYFTNGGPGSGHFTSGPGGWQSMGSQGNSKSFSFSFGGDPGVSRNPFGFDIGDMFSNFFSSGMKGGNNYGGFSGSAGATYGSEPSMVEDINSQLYNKQIRDQGMTWLLLFYTPSSRGYHMLESIAEDVAGLLHGAVKVGKINCISEQNLCKDLGVSPSKSAKLFVYSYRSGDRGSLVEYTDNSDARSLKTFCQDHLPRFSKRVDLGKFDFSAGNTGNHPEVLLLSAKKDTPVIWRALSGLYRKRFTFYDAEVHDVSHPMLKRLGVKALPAVVGKLVNGEVHVLKTGIAVKDLKSGINELRTLLENFEKKNKKVASSQAKKPSQTESQGKGVSNLTATNMDTVCGEGTAVCIIGVFRSSKAKEMLEPVLYALSHETLVRRPDSGVAVSYSLLDARKQSAFLYSFDKAGYKSLDKLLVAYKPRKGKFAVNTDELTMEEAERFVSSVLNGDVQFSKIRQKPQLS